VILGVLFIGQVAVFGMRASFGSYISPWEHDFAVSRTVVTSISMLGFVVFAFGQPVAGKLDDIFGKGVVLSAGIFLLGISLFLASRATAIWQVYALYGVGFSLGVAGSCSAVSSAIITHWFKEKRGFALGLTASGMAIGQLILVPVNLFVIETHGWRTAMSALGIIIVVVVGPLFIFLLRSRPAEKGLKPYGYKETAAIGEPGETGGTGEISETAAIDEIVVLSETGETGAPAAPVAPTAKKQMPIINVFKTKALWQLTIPYFVCGFTDVGLIQTHLIPMTQGRNFPVTSVALAFSLIAAFNIAGSIITGHLSDHFSRSRQLAIIYSVRAATYILLIFLRQPWMLIPFAVTYGFVEMASVAPTNAIAVQLFDGYSIGTLLGLVSVSHQIGGAVGSWIPGLLYDLTGTYTLILIVSILMLSGASLMVMRVPDIIKKAR